MIFENSVVIPNFISFFFCMRCTNSSMIKIFFSLWKQITICLRLKVSQLLRVAFFLVREFKRLSVAFVDQCFRINKDRTKQLLIYRLNNWGGQCCLSLACAIEHEEFMAHVSCQGVLTEIWTGYLKTSQNSSLKVRNFLFTTFLTAFRTAQGGQACCVFTQKGLSLPTQRIQLEMEPSFSFGLNQQGVLATTTVTATRT